MKMKIRRSFMRICSIVAFSTRSRISLRSLMEWCWEYYRMVIPKRLWTRWLSCITSIISSHRNPPKPFILLWNVRLEWHRHIRRSWNLMGWLISLWRLISILLLIRRPCRWRTLCCRPRISLNRRRISCFLLRR